MSYIADPPPEAADETAGALAEELGLEADDRDLATGLLRFGVTADQIRAAHRHGRVEDAIYEGVLDPERARRTISAAEIEAEDGQSVAEIQAILHNMGLPPPAADDPYFTPEEAQVFREFGRLRDIWPLEVGLEASRVYGQALGRIAQTEIHLFRARAEPLAKGETPSPLVALGAIREAFESLLPLADPLLLGVHRRKIEQELTQAAVSEAESQPGGLVPGSVEVCLLFCDLKHFTAFANRQGDAAAIEVVERLGQAVEANRGENGRVVKALGDGYMLAYPEPAPAVVAALGIAAAMRGFEAPPLHAGVHRGMAVLRGGDYYGRAVNLTARLMTAAQGDELLATDAVAAATPEYPWKKRGKTTLRGFRTPLELFELDLRG